MQSDKTRYIFFMILGVTSFLGSDIQALSLRIKSPQSPVLCSVTGVTATASIIYAIKCELDYLKAEKKLAHREKIAQCDVLSPEEWDRALKTLKTDKTEKSREQLYARLSALCALLLTGATLVQVVGV